MNDVLIGYIAVCTLLIGCILIVLVAEVIRGKKVTKPINKPATISKPIKAGEFSYQEWKKRLQEELKYSKLNPNRPDAKVIPFPMERVRRNGKK